MFKVVIEIYLFMNVLSCRFDFLVCFPPKYTLLSPKCPASFTDLEQLKSICFQNTFFIALL